MSKKVFAVLVVFIISAFLAFLWFRNGFILGSAESGLPFDNLERHAQITGWAWAYPALGNVNGIINASWLTYWTLSLFEKLGIEGFLIEGVVFWFLLVVAGVSIYLVTRELFPTMQEKFLVLASLFYLFNPLFLVNVWHRFLLNHMFFIALLPLAILLFLKGIKSRDYKYVIWIGVASVVFSFALTSTAFNILIWTLFLYTTLFFLFLEEDHKQRFFYLLFFSFTFAFYLLINAWWISQVAAFIFSRAREVVVSEFFGGAGNLLTLQSLSQQLGLFIFTTRFLHASFFSNKEELLSQLFTFPPVAFVGFLITGTILFAVAANLRNRNVLFLGILFFSSLFLMKGSNPPFGEIFEFIFVNIPSLQVFRNPFEKFGFLLPLCSAPLFAFGLQSLTLVFNQLKIRNLIYISLFSFILLFWGFPFWTGLVFKSSQNVGSVRNYEVKVPSYYKDVDEWFKQQGGDFRFISFPLSDQGITYTWEKPYSGVELSSTLYSTPNISFNTTIPHYNEIVSDLERLFLSGGDFPAVMNILNARYIVLREDVEWKKRAMRNPQTFQVQLANKENFEKIGEFGELSVWENKTWQDQKIYGAGALVGSFPNPQISDLLKIKLKEPLALYSGGDYQDFEGILMHPKYEFYLDSPPPLFFEERQDIFPHISYLPSHPLYRIMLLKEEVEKKLTKSDEELARKAVALLGKRLHEVKSSAEGERWDQVPTSLELYRRQLEEFKAVISRLTQLSIGLERRVWRQGELYDIFARHSNLMEEVQERTATPEIIEEIEETKKYLLETLIQLAISPKHDYISNDLSPIEKRQTYQFELTRAGEYELLLVESGNLSHFYENPFISTSLQIDDEFTRIRGTLRENGLISLGKFYFDQGVHTIGFNIPQQKNLIEAPNEFTVEVEHGEGLKSFEIQNFDPFTKYEVTFEYRIKRGSGLEFFLESNNDVRVKEKVIPTFSKVLSPDMYEFDFQRYSPVVLTARPGADRAWVGIRVRPWNDCETIFRAWRRLRCKDEAFRRSYDRKTEVIIRNFSVKRVFTNELVLRVTDKGSRNLLPQLSYEKVNPTFYKVMVRGAKEKFYLIFSELYNPGWQAKFDDGSIVSNEHFLANAYANGWVIDRSGDYEIAIKFAPQDLLDKAKSISLFSFLGGIAFLGAMFVGRKK